MKTIKLAAVVVAAFAFTACGGKAAKGEEPVQQKQPSASSVEAIKKRAAFELSCPEDQLNVTVLETGNMMRPWTFGVAGCEKRATYLYRAGTIINQSTMPAAGQ